MIVAAPGFTAAHTWVAAPCGMVLRKIGPATPIANRSPAPMCRPSSVWMTPGCTALLVRPVGRRLASSRANRRLASLDWPYPLQGV